MDADVLTTRVVDGIAVITLGTERRIYIDQETSEAERKGFVHETVKGNALDRTIQIARHLSSFTPESLAYIKRLVSDAALSRMRAYDKQDSASPSRLT